MHPEICSLVTITSSQPRSQDSRVRKAPALPFPPESGESPQADRLILRTGNRGWEDSVQWTLLEHLSSPSASHGLQLP